MCIHEGGTIQKEKPKDYNQAVRTGDNVAYANGAVRVDTDNTNNVINIHIDSRLFDSRFEYVRTVDLGASLCLDDAIALRRLLDGAIVTMQENNVKKLRENCPAICPVDSGSCGGLVYEP